MDPNKKEERFFKKFLDAESNRLKSCLRELAEKQPQLQHAEILSKFEKCICDTGVTHFGLEDVKDLIGVILINKLDYASQKSVLDLWPKTRTRKNNANSEKCRELGNQFLLKDQLGEAVEQYNEAVLWAEFGSKPFALALANRAAAWMKCKEYNLAVKDLELALDCVNYPDGNRFKLFQRLAKAFEGTKDFARAYASYQSVLDHMSRSELDESQKSKLRGETLKAMKQCHKNAAVSSFINLDVKLSPSASFPTYKRHHELITKASDCVGVAFSEMKGRHAVAARDIEVGECIIDEEPAVLMNDLKNCLSHCYGCMKNVIAPYPCATCSAVVFCDEKCRERSKFAHDHDCQLSFYDLHLQHGIQGSGFTILIFLAFQLVSQRSPYFFTKHFPKLSEPKSDELPIGKPDLHSIDIILNMASHWKNMEDLIDIVSSSVFLLNVLETSNYFSSSDDKIETRIYFAHLLFRFSCALRCNNHSISEIGSVPMGVERKRVGMGLFPTVASLFNHSCDPNTATVMISKSQVTVATRKIKSGEEICHIYQTHFGDSPFEKRQSTLMELYNFSCQCQACLKKYPLAKNLTKTYEEAWANQKSTGIDQKTAKELDTRHQMIGEQILDALDKNDLATMEQLYCQRLKLASEHLWPNPHMIFLSNRSGLIDTLWLRFGNRNYTAKGETMKGAYM